MAMEKENIYVVYGEYPESPAELLSAHKSADGARKGLKRAVKGFYTSLVSDNGAEGFEEFWENGISDEGLEFTDRGRYQSEPTIFTIQCLPVAE